MLHIALRWLVVKILKEFMAIGVKHPQQEWVIWLVLGKAWIRAENYKNFRLNIMKNHQVHVNH